mgnify:CR=1 FL=1
MLSLILKPLFKNSDSNINDLELPFDTEISLSMIESGCIFISLYQMATLIIISPREELLQLNNINKITFNFELIERPEFPSVGMHIDINTVSNNPFKFEYFFNTESPEEVELLKKLTHQDHFDMLLYDSQVLYSKKIMLSKDDKLELNSLVDRASQSFDKIG